MLATFVVGLREGLEAALIVGIIAAFLRQSGRPDAVRRMWVGVFVAVAMCLGVGVLLQAVNSALPQRQQEMLECVIAAVAVAMVSYMVLWMRSHSRSLKADLQMAADGALASGSATALVVMAFLAVFREGFETAVFLLAAFQSAVSPAQAATGALLGIVVAAGLGWAIYRGGMRLNLAKFFRFTGAVLVLVAAGLVVSTLRAAHEAGWLTVGQQQSVSLSLIARSGTVQESLLTGVLGIRSAMPVVEVVAYLLYLLPMLAVVLWPAKRTPTGARLGRVLGAAAAVSLLFAAGLAVFTPAAATSAAPAVLAVDTTRIGADVSDTTSGRAATGESVSVEVDPAGDPAMRLSPSGGLTGTSQLTLSGSVQAGTRSATRYTGTPVKMPVDAVAAGLPATRTIEALTALGGGRLPIGLSAAAGANAILTVDYTDSWTPTVTVDAATGTVLDLRATSVRSITARDTAGRAFPMGAMSTDQVAANASSVQAQRAVAADRQVRRDRAEVLGQVLPALLGAFAAALLAFALPNLVRARRLRPRRLRRRPPAASAPEAVGRDQAEAAGRDQAEAAGRPPAQRAAAQEPAPTAGFTAVGAVLTSRLSSPKR